MKFSAAATFVCLHLCTSAWSFGTPTSPSTHGRGHGRRAATSFDSRSLPPSGIAAWTRGGEQVDGADRRISSTTCLSATVDSSTTTPATVSASNMELLSERGRSALQRLIDFDSTNGAQAHVYGDWPEAGTQDDDKRRLAEQLADLDESYPGGLPAYLGKARMLLKESADGVNPFENYEALVPEGESLVYDGKGTMDFNQAEEIGLNAIKGAAFVLVAGGLGERLGYSGIKLSLETNLAANTCYLEFYAKYILAVQHQARISSGDDTIRIPLVIMTSGDTDPLTRQMLKEKDYFGMDEDMVSIVTQDKVAALKDGGAGLALKDDDRWSVQTKPHGHGDVHHLLLREGIVDKWEEEGRSHVVFLQDTNALVVNSILPTLGVSISKGFHMNSICIPRLAGEAAGAISRLEHKTDPTKSLVINVEYNQLDPLLKSQGDRKGDVADPDTGYSPFPGNANNIIIELGAYAKTLRGDDQGVVLEFVNPKYKDDTRTEFKKPTRLECMMQDIPKLFQKEMQNDVNIGFTMFDRWYTFSPAKNSLESGVSAVEGGNFSPGTLSSAESDLYIQNQRKLKHAGADLPVTAVPDGLMKIGGIPVTPGPRIILEPAFALSQQQIAEKINGEGVKITERSSLILDGHNIKVKGLDLDGALVIRAGPESHVTVDGLKVENKGWELVDCDPEKDYDEIVSIRGYTMSKLETKEYSIEEPGNFVIGADGEVTKVD